MYLGLNKNGEPLTLDAADLATHGVVLGRTGSGKTGLQIMLIEEAAAAGASVIVFDPKGDLTNLALPLTSPQEFARWVSPGTTPEAAFARHQKGLAGFGLGIPDAAKWRSGVRTLIYAPGKTYGGGRPLSIFPRFRPPRAVSRDSASRAVSTVLQALKEGDDPYDPALVFMTEAVLAAWKRGLALPVDMWPGLITSPPSYLQEFGGMKVDAFFSKRKRNSLARKLIGFHHQADRWLNGSPLDLHAMTSGKP
ncbi:MAG TPA: helicase HerA-like domain-containing protein, partial [Anaerolineae bacterium]|nr:helicase HerA-like domain-containing protein [Anaerolineae bacterium]